jgi:hypothetical protein
MIGENNMRWKKYSEEKPTSCEHEYLVKTKGLSGVTSYDIYNWADNLSEVDEYNFKDMEEDGFYYFDPEWGFLNIEVRDRDKKLYGEDNELYWIDLTEADLEWSKGGER